ncbi:MAG: hypothetical protein FJZ16_01580 [Candidatus Omnitrophica bacterium]|nr:hypothetical protein [Candidatus Omnitrophota bacterium]
MILTISVLYLNFLIRPKLTKLMELNARETNLKLNIVNMEKELNILDEYKEKLNSLKTESQDLKKRLSDSKELPNLISEFSKIARDLDVKLISIKPLTKPSQIQEDNKMKKPYVSLPIEIEATSGFHQMGTFINELENLDIFIKLIGLDIEESEDSPFMHKVKFTLNTFASSEISQ